MSISQEEIALAVNGFHADATPEQKAALEKFMVQQSRLEAAMNHLLAVNQDVVARLDAQSVKDTTISDEEKMLVLLSQHSSVIRDRFRKVVAMDLKTRPQDALKLAAAHFRAVVTDDDNAACASNKALLAGFSDARLVSMAKASVFENHEGGVKSKVVEKHRNEISEAVKLFVSRKSVADLSKLLEQELKLDVLGEDAAKKLGKRAVQIVRGFQDIEEDAFGAEVKREIRKRHREYFDDKMNSYINKELEKKKKHAGGARADVDGVAAGAK